MNISKILLIDAALVIAAIPFLFLLKDGKKISQLLRGSNKEELLRKASVDLPGKEKLIELEKIAKNHGSGIKFDSLIGVWKFVSVWNQDLNEENSIFSSLLRVFSANIGFKKDISTEYPPRFSIIASIQFGLFTIEYSGPSYLKGKQPYILFFLNQIELKAGSNILLSRSIDEPVEKEKSYFALIALGENGEWLSARGQGGAVVIWLKD